MWIAEENASEGRHPFIRPLSTKAPAVMKPGVNISKRFKSWAYMGGVSLRETCNSAIGSAAASERRCSILRVRSDDCTADVHVVGLIDGLGDAASDRGRRDGDVCDPRRNGIHDGCLDERVREISRNHTRRHFGKPQMGSRFLPQGLADRAYGILGRGIDAHRWTTVTPGVETTLMTYPLRRLVKIGSAAAMPYSTVFHPQLVSSCRK